MSHTNPTIDALGGQTMVDTHMRPRRLTERDFATMDPQQAAIERAHQDATMSDAERTEALRREVLDLDQLDWHEQREPPDDWGA